MERIGDTLKRLGNHAGFQERYQKMRAEILQNPHVSKFLARQGGYLTDEAIEKGLMTLYEYSRQVQNCEICQSLEECRNLMKGYQPELIVRGGMIHIQYTPCRKK